MKKLLACAAFGVLSLAAPAAVLAQDVASLEVSRRVVIAPPQNPLAETIKAALGKAYDMARPDTAAYDQAQQLYFFYGARHFEPLWLDLDATGKLVFSETAREVIDLFENAALEGLRPEDYLTPDLDVDAARNDPAAMAALETAFSAAAVRYATHIHTGRIRPSDVSPTLDIAPKSIDEAKLLMDLAAAEAPAKVFAALGPKHPEFLALKAALAEFEDIERPPAIEAGPLLKPGMTDSRVPLLRERLGLPAATVDVAFYDPATVETVEEFQQGLGLEPDGVVGPATVAALNGGNATSREDIIANMERWRWMPEDLGAFNVFVNIPEFKLAINDHGKETFTTRVVVGTTKNQTPVFSDSIRHIVVNPYWNVPSSIIEGEVAPAMLRNPGYIASQNMELLFNGAVINPASVNWAIVNPDNFPFRVRQRPGTGNALGQIKFLFPNKHDVYLHDTPSKALFSRSTRAFSHGCIRVQDPMAFADALMANEPDISRASLEAMFGSSERWVNPDKQIPIHIAYFTLRVDEDGSIRSYDDIYGHNETLIALLKQ